MWPIRRFWRLNGEAPRRQPMEGVLLRGIGSACFWSGALQVESLNGANPFDSVVVHTEEVMSRLAVLILLRSCFASMLAQSPSGSSTVAHLESMRVRLYFEALKTAPVEDRRL